MRQWNKAHAVYMVKPVRPAMHTRWHVMRGVFNAECSNCVKDTDDWT